MLKELEAIHADALSAISEIADADGLEAFRIAYLGRKGRITVAAAGMKDIPKEAKPAPKRDYRGNQRKGTSPAKRCRCQGGGQY